MDRWEIPLPNLVCLGLNCLGRFLELRDKKQISSDALIELTEIVLKNYFFEFDQKTFK